MKPLRTWCRPGSAWAFAWILLPIAVLLAYLPGIDGGFVFDDMPNIVENSALHVTRLDAVDWVAAAFSSPSSELRRPLASLSFAANHYFTGLDGRAMKLTNIAIHALNALLVFGLVRELLRCAARLPGALRVDADRVALFTAAFWALNPINLMAVLYAVQRMESLSHLWVFAALWCYAWLRRTRPLDGRSLLLAGSVLVIGAVLGTLSKESAVLTTLYSWSIEMTLLRQDWSRAEGRRSLQALYTLLLWIPAMAAVAYLLPRSLHPGAFSGRDFDLVERLMTEPRVLVDYLRWTVVPDLSAMGLYHDDYPVSRGLLVPWTTLASIGVLIAMLLLAWRLRMNRPLTALGLSWFLSAHVLTASFLPLELVFEHRNYFASLGIALVLADLLLVRRATQPARRSGPVIALLLLAIAAGATNLRAREWSDPLRFASSEAARHPLSPRATYERARALIMLTNYQRTSPLDEAAMEAVEKARRVPGTNVLPAQAALLYGARTGRELRPEWWEDLDAHLRGRGTLANVAALRSLVDCSIQRLCNFPPERMLASFSAALEKGDSAPILNVYGNYALNALGDPDLALRAWEGAVAANPKEPQYHAHAASLLLALGRPEEAKVHIQAIRSLGRFGEYEHLARSIEARQR